MNNGKWTGDGLDKSGSCSFELDSCGGEGELDDLAGGELLRDMACDACADWSTLIDRSPKSDLTIHLGTIP